MNFKLFTKAFLLGVKAFKMRKDLKDYIPFFNCEFNALLKEYNICDFETEFQLTKAFQAGINCQIEKSERVEYEKNRVA